MDPNQMIGTPTRVPEYRLEIIPKSFSQPSQSEKTHDQSKEIFSKYPPNSIITKLSSTLEIKQYWLLSEWEIPCQFSKFIRPNFPDKSHLDPYNKKPNIQLINSTFHNVRGKFDLWGTPREEGRWKKIVTENLTLDWVEKNIEVLYPAEERFAISRLDGIVLWKQSKEKKYQLHEGNHRISTWLAIQNPKNLPATIFIGKPKKK